MHTYITGETYVTNQWIGGNLPLITYKIQFWNEVNRDYMLIEGDEEIWYSWDENGNW